MFEDSTFESTGRIKTRSRRWMIATFTINGSIVLALILIPLVFPAALPRQAIQFLMVAPAAPTPQTPPPVHVRALPFHSTSQMVDGHFLAPRTIPINIVMVGGREDDAPNSNLLSMDSGPVLPGGAGDVFRGRRTQTVHADVNGPVRVSSMVVEGLIIRKTIPQYPPIPKAMGIQGTVVLQATISKSGTIENLHVINGPAMLQQAALDAVRTWRYKPYMLNEQPVEVETTVNVVFSISH
jgi:periplasmic protein TonB